MSAVSPGPEQALDTGLQPTVPPIVGSRSEEFAGETGRVAPAKPSVRSSVADAWHARGLLRPLGSRFLAKFTQGAKLGRMWLIIRPVTDALGKTVIFGGLLGLPSAGGIPYFLFVLAGLTGWRLFERSLRYSSRSFSVYRKLMKRHDFPLLLVPLAGMAYPIIEVVVYCLVLICALAVYAVADHTLYLNVSPELLLMLPGAVLVIAITIGLSLWTSVLTAKARDVRYLMRYVLPVWLYLTPVVYPSSKLPKDYAWLTTLNPMSGPIDLIKLGLFGVGQVTPAALVSSAGFGILVLLSGLWFFSRAAPWSIEQDSGIDDDDEDDE